MLRTHVFSASRLLVLGAVGCISVPFASAAATDSSVCAQSTSPVVVPADVMRNQLTKLQQSNIVPSSKETGPLGSMVLSLVIDCTGKVVKNTVVSGSNSMTDAAVAMVNGWTYKPYMVNGVAVDVKTTTIVTFGRSK
jgi:hypothetical protein